jgi:sulfate permease, SulP family
VGGHARAEPGHRCLGPRRSTPGLGRRRRNPRGAVDGPLFYANSLHVKERLLGLAHRSDLRPRAVVLELAESPDVDVQTIDVLGKLAEELASDGIELHLASVRQPVIELLDRAGLTDRIHVEPTIDAAVSATARSRQPPATAPRE